MKKFSSSFVLILLFSSAVSYRIIDLQNDDAAVYIEDLEQNNKSEMTENILKANILKEIKQKIHELESSNNVLKNELQKTRDDLRNQEKSNKKTANVQLTTKYEEDRYESGSFWKWICAASKLFVRGILNYFSLEM